jgi:hypothetical protein
MLALLVCCLSVPSMALPADSGPTRFRAQAREPAPVADTSRFSIRAQPAADAAVPRFQLAGGKRAKAGVACEQADELFMNDFED